MDLYYILIIVVLFLLAISLLIVGVSNDAVNFLNSAIGSKAAPFRWIIAVAAVGILGGVVFSNGMMEVARKGIFNPEQFAFNEIMVIFLAVMLTNILLLDFFNTVGLPTSTTVSVVFGILGAAVAVALYKITRTDTAIDGVGTFINLESSVLIIAGIFLSVIIAFNAGIIVQWIVRLAFSFNIGKSYKYWSGIWGGFAITAILYFLFIKGARGSTLVSPEMLNYIEINTTRILLIGFAGLTMIFQLMVFFTRINILKLIVLAGTFALAMAFAGNDLVNFIGVPLAGFESFKAFTASGSADPGGFRMGALREPVITPVCFLLTAGVIMVLTLRYSLKAKSVTATTIDLSRQDEGSERFASTLLARFIVRRSIEISNGIAKITPPAVTRFTAKRFYAGIAMDENHEKAAFDLVRGSVNLVVASVLIAFGTSLKLPLSTTYVTFMVAMGTSFADGAWGRDSAVYRITGVLTVVGGWLFTALSACLVSLIIASLIFFGKLPVILILLALSVFILIKTHALHRRKIRKEKPADSEIVIPAHEIISACDDKVKSSVIEVSKIFYLSYNNFIKEKHKELYSLRKETKHLNKDIKQVLHEIPITLKKFHENDLENCNHYIQVVSCMKEMCNSLMNIVQPAFNHLDNNHAFDRKQNDKLKDFNEKISEFFNFVINLLKNKKYDNLDELIHRRDEMINLTNDILLNRIKILKKTQKGIKVSVTYIEMLSETKNLLLNVVHLVKADFDLIQSITSGKEIVKMKEMVQ